MTKLIITFRNLANAPKNRQPIFREHRAWRRLCWGRGPQQTVVLEEEEEEEEEEKKKKKKRKKMNYCI